MSIEKARAVIPAIEAAAVRAHVAGIHLQRFNEDLAASPIRVESGARVVHGLRRAAAEMRRASAT